MTLQEIFGLTVLGACVTTIGSLIALFLKEFVAARWLEGWKDRRTLLTVYRRYQLPIFLAAEELSGRLYGLSRADNDRDERMIGVSQLRHKPLREPHAAVSDHYLRYRFLSNAYRLCSFLGWVELYRRDVGTLDTEASIATATWTRVSGAFRGCWPTDGSISMQTGASGRIA